LQAYDPSLRFGSLLRPLFVIFFFICFFSFHLPLCTFISRLSLSHCNSFPFHFMFPVIFHFSLHFPSQSFIILFPSTLLSIPLSFKLLPFQFSRHLRLFLPNFPTFIYSSSSSASFPLTFVHFSHFIHSFPIFFTLLLVLHLRALASSFFLYLPFPFTYFFLHPV